MLGARWAHASVRMDPAKTATFQSARWKRVSHPNKSLYKTKNICFVAVRFVSLDNYMLTYVIIKLYINTVATFRVESRMFSSSSNMHHETYYTKPPPALQARACPLQR
jgi:hypothetical protein